MKNWIPQKTLSMTVRVATGLCVLIYCGSLFLVLMEIRKIEDYYNSIESKSGQEERGRVLIAIAETNKENIQTLRNFFIRRGDEVTFIEKIEAVAQKSGVQFEISAIDVKKEEKNAFKEDVEVRMEIEGPWLGIMSFVDGLEKLDFGVLIQNFNIDSKLGAGWGGNITFTVFREK